MRINDNSRPKEITSNEIWELYKLLESLDEHYVFYDKCDAPENKEELFYLESTEIGDRGMIYEAPDNMGIQFPYSKNEWVELSLTNMANGRKQRTIVKIEINTLLKTNLTVEELLKKNHVRIPTAAELAGYEYEVITYGSGTDSISEKLPVVHFPVKVNDAHRIIRPDSETVKYWMESDMRGRSVPYTTEIDNGIPRIKFVYMCDHAPGGFIDGCIWFFDKVAETQVYYNQMGADICRKSECRQELLRLLNFINARVFREINDGGNRWYDPRILYIPRMYLTENDGYNISVTTMLNYRFWRTAMHETTDYITSYQPELLNKLAPFVFGVLKGELTADDVNVGGII